MTIIEIVKVIEEALTFFLIDEKGVHWKGKFVDLKMAACKNNRLSRAVKLADYIKNDIWNIGTIIHRLNWQRSASINQKFLEEMWNSYASIDIEHFHIKLRSIMDYVAGIVPWPKNKRGQIPDDSFEGLINWIKKNPGHLKQIGEDLINVVKTAETWFKDLRYVRDKLIHNGASTVIFCHPKDGILFHVKKDHKDNVEFKSISNDFLMFNPNVIYFERYAAIFLSHLFVFLDRLAKLIYKRYQLQCVERSSSCHSKGFSIIVYWMKQLKEILEKRH
jgi:hypothetical protein